MNDGDTMVFVEVRYRKNNRFGGAAESIDRYKQSKLIACANHYIATNNSNDPARFDVVTIMPYEHDYQFDWIQDAFQV